MLIITSTIAYFIYILDFKICISDINTCSSWKMFLQEIHFVIINTYQVGKKNPFFTTMSEQMQNLYLKWENVTTAIPQSSISLWIFTC